MHSLKRKNVLLVCNNFPDVIDGVGDYTYNLLNSLIALGGVIFVVCRKSQEISNFVIRNDLQGQVFPIVTSWNFQSLVIISRIIRKNKINSILVQYVPYSYHKKGIPFIICLMAILAKLTKTKFYVYFHEVTVRLLGYGTKSFILAIVQRAIAFFLCLVSNSVLTNSKLSTQILSVFKVNLVPVPSNFENHVCDSRVKSTNCSEVGPRLLSFSNRCEIELIKAIKQLVTEYPNLKLILVGTAPKNKLNFIKLEIKKYELQNHIIVNGHTSISGIIESMSNADLYIQLEKLSRKNEGGVSTKSGLIMAAMNVGLPIISTRGDMTDSKYFRHLDNMFLIEKNNEKDILHALRFLITNADITWKLRQNARITYFSCLSWREHSKVISKWIDLKSS